MRKAFAEGAIADLIVVLEEGHESRWSQMARRLTANDTILMRRWIALIGEAFSQRPSEMLERTVGIIFIIAFILSGQKSMPRVMNVIGPLRRVKRRLPTGVAAEPTRLICLIFKHQMNVPIRDGFTNSVCQLFDEVRLTVIHYGMNGIEAKTVDMEFLQPIQRIVEEEVAHITAAFSVHVDARSPWSRVALREEGLGIGMEIVSRRAEVIVDHVEEDHDAERVRTVDKALQVVGAAISSIRRVRQDTVITPVPAPGELADGHELDGRDA